MYYLLLCHNPWKVENGKKCRLDPFGTAQSICASVCLTSYSDCITPECICASVWYRILLWRSDRRPVSCMQKSNCFEHFAVCKVEQNFESTLLVDDSWVISTVQSSVSVVSSVRAVECITDDSCCCVWMNFKSAAVEMVSVDSCC